MDNPRLSEYHVRMTGGQRELSRQLKIRSANAIEAAATVQRLRHEVRVLRATMQEYEQPPAVLKAEVVQLSAEHRRLWEPGETAVIRTKDSARSLFGRKSERQTPSPRAFCGNRQPIGPRCRAGVHVLPPAAGEPSASPRRRRYANLPTRHEYRRLPDDELQCPICGILAQNRGEEISEQIDCVVRLERLVTQRQRYRYPCHCREFADPIAVSATAPDADAAGSADGGAPARAPASGTVNAPVGSLMPGEAGATTVCTGSSMSAASETTNELGSRTLMAPRPTSRGKALPFDAGRGFGEFYSHHRIPRIGRGLRQVDLQFVGTANTTIIAIG